MKASISKHGVRHQNKITLTLNAVMMDKVKDESAAKAMSVATWLRAALIDYLKRVSDTCVNA